MKSILIIVLTLLPLSSFSASGCFGGKNEIEMLELTYMTEKELIDEYCYASNSMKRFIGGGSYYSENINACSDYSERIFRVLRKDHGIKSMKHIECPEWKKEIEKLKKAFPREALPCHHPLVTHNFTWMNSVSTNEACLRMRFDG